MDAEGRLIPVASDEITFRVAGSGRLIGVGNGDPSSHESDRGPVRHAFNGLCMALVQASRQVGVLRIEATAPGLQSGMLEITGIAASPRPSA